MQPMDEKNEPLGPKEPLDVDKLKTMLEEGADHVKVTKEERILKMSADLGSALEPTAGHVDNYAEVQPLRVGKQFNLDGMLFEVTKALKGNRFMIKRIR